MMSSSHIVAKCFTDLEVSRIQSVLNVAGIKSNVMQNFDLVTGHYQAVIVSIFDRQKALKAVKSASRGNA
jgi:hypothetical protein